MNRPGRVERTVRDGLKEEILVALSKGDLDEVALAMALDTQEVETFIEENIWDLAAGIEMDMEALECILA